MLVKDVMTTSIRTTTVDSSVLEVASLMCLYRLSGLPVVDDNHKLIGFIAEKDVLHHMFPTLEDLMAGNMGAIDLDAMMDKYGEISTLKVSDLMTKNVITVSPDMHILRATTVMVRNRFRRIPVAENGILKGILSLGDVHKAIFHHSISKIK
jgi:CBS domain-containing protein